MSVLRAFELEGLRFEAAPGGRLRFGPPEVVTPRLRSLVARHKTAIMHELQGADSERHDPALAPLPEHLEAYNPTLGELAAFYGEEWQRECENPHWLGLAVAALRESKLIAAGIVPPWFTQDGHCLACGPVKLGVATSALLVACPWCHHGRRPPFPQ